MPVLVHSLGSHSLYDALNAALAVDAGSGVGNYGSDELWMQVPVRIPMRALAWALLALDAGLAPKFFGKEGIPYSFKVSSTEGHAWCLGTHGPDEDFCVKVRRGAKEKHRR